MLLIIWAKNGNFFQKCTEQPPTAWTICIGSDCHNTIKSEFRPRALKLHSEILIYVNGTGFISTSPQRIQSNTTITNNCGSRARNAYDTRLKQAVDLLNLTWNIKCISNTSRIHAYLESKWFNHCNIVSIHFKICSHSDFTCASTCSLAHLHTCAIAHFRKFLRKHLCKYLCICAPAYLRTCALTQILAQILVKALAYVHTCAIAHLRYCANTCAILYFRTCALAQVVAHLCTLAYLWTYASTCTIAHLHTCVIVHWRIHALAHVFAQLRICALAYMRICIFAHLRPYVRTCACTCAPS